MTEKKNRLVDDLKSVASDIADIASDQYGKAKKGADAYLDKHPEYKERIDTAHASFNENVAPRVKSVTSDVLNASIGIMNASASGMSMLKSKVDASNDNDDDDVDDDDNDDEGDDDDDPERWDDAELIQDTDRFDLEDLDDEAYDDWGDAEDAIESLSSWVEDTRRNVDVIINDTPSQRKLQWLHVVFDEGTRRLGNARVLVHKVPEYADEFNDVYPDVRILLMAIECRFLMEE